MWVVRCFRTPFFFLLFILFKPTGWSCVVFFYVENIYRVLQCNISTIIVHDMCCKKTQKNNFCFFLYEKFFRFNHMRKFTNHCNCSVRRKVITLNMWWWSSLFIHFICWFEIITEYCKLSMLFIYLYNYNYKQLICYLCTLNKHYYIFRKTRDIFCSNEPSSTVSENLVFGWISLHN